MIELPVLTKWITDYFTKKLFKREIVICKKNRVSEVVIIRSIRCKCEFIFGSNSWTITMSHMRTRPAPLEVQVISKLSHNSSSDSGLMMNECYIIGSIYMFGKETIKQHRILFNCLTGSRFSKPIDHLRHMNTKEKFFEYLDQNIDFGESPYKKK